MKLIDADRVKEYVLTEGFYCDTYADKKDTAKEIDELFPTVKAIPIEWIETYIASRTSLSINWSYVYDMLKDWEKENEKGN